MEEREGRQEKERKGKGIQGLGEQGEEGKEKGEHSLECGCASPLAENKGLYQRVDAHS